MFEEYFQIYKWKYYNVGFECVDNFVETLTILKRVKNRPTKFPHHNDKHYCMLVYF